MMINILIHLPLFYNAANFDYLEFAEEEAEQFSFKVK